MTCPAPHRREQQSQDWNPGCLIPEPSHHVHTNDTCLDEALCASHSFKFTLPSLLGHCSNSRPLGGPSEALACSQS